MNKTAPLVSIIINNYNYGQFLPDAIESVLGQTYQNIEVIVVDDGSTDNSREIVLKYENRVMPVFKQNGDQASALNSGFQASKGDIICFLDADDTFERDKVNEVVQAFSLNDGIGWCFHPLRLVNQATGRQLSLTRTFAKREQDESSYCDFRAAIQGGATSFYAPATSGLCFSRGTLSSILPMPEQLYKAADRYITSLALFISPGYFLASPLTTQKIHDNNCITLNDDIQAVRKKGRNQIAMAYFLKQKAPELYRYCNRAFSRGVSILWKSGGHISDSSTLINEYMSHTSMVEKVVIGLSALYQVRPWKRNRQYVWSERAHQ